MNIEYGDYLISDDKEMLQIENIYRLLSETYWASQRTKETVKRSIEKSMCIGIYFNGVQVGFARIVTDFATVYWLCDVVVDERHRSKGLGRELLKAITQDNNLKLLTGVLKTKNAHSLYEKFGFVRDPDRFMRKS